MPEKEYIGDGAFVSFDGFGIMLTTSNGVIDTNEIYLDPEVLAAFISYIKRIISYIKRNNLCQTPDH